MKYVVLFILAILSSNVKAQYVKDKGANYEGSIELNSAASLNDTPFSMFGVETIHGVLLAENWVFVGLGVGVNVVHFTPYVEKMTGDVTPEMFHYDLQKYVCPAVSLNLGVRADNIRKLRRKIIPFVNVKFMYLWNFKNTTGLTINYTEEYSTDIPVGYVESFLGQFSVGAEFKLGDLPNIYVGCGGLMASAPYGEGYHEGAFRVNNGTEAGETKTFSGGYKIKAPTVFFIKVGMHLWKRK